MLKALELSGFKSFAEKTRFEFPAGITVVVGPNGSGKSNIVDAIKWVLGEQSAKSLRGKDMSDVIFKGSGGPSGRRPANAAQATIVLENADRRFDFDADEVHVSRRVYRSGDTEYLINGEVSRLKNIRALFRGTGVGTDAYSLIEQGKVERMLQTNAKDRRAIFEEAAGISRFKAKKVEAERRLARVEANLIRLADIVDEVGSRYRSIKAQASKAARYKEYSDRLKELRTFVGRNDWREYSEKMESYHQQAGSVVSEIDSLKQNITQDADQLKQVEAELETVTQQLADHQESATQVREKLAQTQSQLELNQSRIGDLNQRKQQLEEQFERSKNKSKALESQIAESAEELQQAEIKFRDSSNALKEVESERESTETELTAIRRQNEQRRDQHVALMAAISEIGKQFSVSESQLQSLETQKSKTDAEIVRLQGQIDQTNNELSSVKQQTDELQQAAESTDSALKNARQEFEHASTELESSQDQLAELTNKQAGMEQRSRVIEELENSLDGVNAGAKSLLNQSKTSNDGHLGEIVGLVADLVSVNVQHAGIVDVALGEVSQHIVVNGHQLIDLLAADQLQLAGRVGIVKIDAPTTLGADPEVNLNGLAGVIGRADRLVQVQPAYTDFIRQMLGGTWIVKTLADALDLHQGQGRRARFVTLDGEIVEADGTVVAGPKAIAAGIVSRRSELRALSRELEKIGGQVTELRTKISELKKTKKSTDKEVQKLIGRDSELAKNLSELKSQSTALSKQIKADEASAQKLQSDQQTIQQQIEESTGKMAADKTQLVAQEATVNELNQTIGLQETTAADKEKRRQELERQVTTLKVQLGKWEQQLSDLESRRAEAISQSEEQTSVIEQTKTQIENDRVAMAEAESNVEQATKDLEILKQKQSTFSDDLEKFNRQRTEIDARRREMSIELTAKRDALRLAEEKSLQAKLQLEQLANQRQQLAERLQEDYGIEIASAEVDATPSSLTQEDLQRRDELDSEISSLRKKLGQIGSVNLDALEELEELESRYLKMDQQYQDLVNAKETLEKIIVRINADSRKLFVETLEAIRQNFQKLFRQTFGGGQADIILEEGADPLEAGVEIVATPPGKPQFNNSLLSGGEKALTAVSLLMAIFQFRPSPFCVLDEVDAPFDEANIGRFVDVLKSFLGWTKFVIVTHSKKTMTAATTLYGITMQESGVSKRVSVRFEDVSEDGHISQQAIDRSDGDAA